jgi:hypothetical protein
VDGVLLTIRVSRNARPKAERAKEILVTLGANLLGVVVNGIDRREGAGGYGYAEYSYYYYAADYRDPDVSYFDPTSQPGEPATAENGALAQKAGNGQLEQEQPAVTPGPSATSRVPPGRHARPHRGGVRRLLRWWK